MMQRTQVSLPNRQESEEPPYLNLSYTNLRMWYELSSLSLWANRLGKGRNRTDKPARKSPL
jgi:hypothetical protein